MRLGWCSCRRDRTGGLGRDRMQGLCAVPLGPRSFALPDMDGWLLVRHRWWKFKCQ